jgi:hypothetical protein
MLKIKNLLDEYSGNCDYKGIDLDKIISGSQFYDIEDENIAILQTREEIVPQHGDIQILTREEYTEMKSLIEEKERLRREEYEKNNPVNILTDTVAQQQAQIDELTLLLGDALVKGVL